MNEIEAVVAALARRMTDKGSPSKQWARDLKAREESGEQLLYCQAAAWREALRAERGDA